MLNLMLADCKKVTYQLIGGPAYMRKGFKVCRQGDNCQP